MDQLLQKLHRTAKDAEKLLDDNDKWINQYNDYAKKILSVKEIIEKARASFREYKPLYVYSSISQIKGTKKDDIKFDLRYGGLSVADIEISEGKNHGDDPRILRPKANIGKTYCIKGIEGGKEYKWLSKNAETFRSYFIKGNPPYKKGKTEHRYESLLLTEFSKKSGKEKKLKNIQPVRLCDNRFQMSTPLKASEGKKGLEYNRTNRSPIDFLCRTGRGQSGRLNVFELKSFYKEPIEVLQQAVIYSVFILKLLKNPDAGSRIWRKLFEYGKTFDIARPLEINAVVAMPMDKKYDNSPEDEKVWFKNQVINVGIDTIRLHYLYFSLAKNEKGDEIIAEIKTSLPNK